MPDFYSQTCFHLTIELLHLIKLPLEGGCLVLTWSKGGPRYNKMVSKDKIKKDVKKWDFQHVKGGLFCNMKEQLMWEGISPKTKITLF